MTTGRPMEMPLLAKQFFIYIRSSLKIASHPFGIGRCEGGRSRPFEKFEMRGLGKRLSDLTLEIFLFLDAIFLVSREFCVGIFKQMAH